MRAKRASNEARREPHGLNPLIGNDRGERTTMIDAWMGHCQREQCPRLERLRHRLGIVRDVSISLVRERLRGLRMALVPGTVGQPHVLKTGHFLQEDNGEPIALRLLAWCAR